jgi:phosphatidylglycerol:prolipoprotein diacylglycerol transferase
MYPILFTIPWIDFPISTFGVMMVVGFLAAYAITAKRLSELGRDPEIAANLLIWCMLGGVLGAKLYYAVDATLRGEIASVSDGLFSRGGMTWYGGFMGGALAGALGARANGLRILFVTNVVAVGCAVGQALGRVGCLLVGDDYGRPTDLPWGIAFPEGSPPVFVPVHPTMIYEVLWLLPIATLLWSRRKKSPFLFGEYLAANGFGRFVIEHWRINDRVALGLTEAQWIGLALVVIGSAGWFYFRSQPPLDSAEPAKA